MKRFYLFLSALLISAFAFSQTYPLVTIQQIQQVPNDSLGTTVNGDLSMMDGDTVTVRGVVVTPPGAAVSSSTYGRWIWIQDGSGPWSGLNVRWAYGSTPSTPDDMLNVVPGDSVEIVGIVESFANETQISPLENNSFTILTGVTGLRPVQMVQFQDLSALDGPNANIPSSVAGEPWEASFVEIFDVTVSNVVTTNSRIRFQVTDNFGNTTEVYDTYTVQRPSPPGNPNEIPYPSFPPPVVGDQFDTIRGIVDGRNQLFPPYNIAPFDTSHYVYGPSAPKILNVFRDIAVPTDAQQVTVTATIADNGGSIVGNPQLFYAFGESNNNFTPVNMTFTGSNNLYTGVIPAGTDGQMVKFYLTATDNDGITTANPSSNPTDKKFFYFVRNTGQVTIRDLQYTIYSDGESGYVGQEVTVQGVVSASSKDGDSPDFNWIQDVNTTEWGGIRVVSDVASANFNNTSRGELVQVTGTVEENFGFTQIRIDDNNDYQILATVGAPTPIDVNPDDFTSYSLANEKYEGLLLRMVAANPGDSIYVVEDNADGGSDFGEYRVGRDKFNPNAGTRVLVGRGGGSHNVSYTTPNVTLDGGYSAQQIIVQPGDRMNSLTGVMYYSFGNLKLLPRQNSDFENYNGGLVSLDRNEVKDHTLKIYPNPTTDEFSLISSFEDKSYEVSLYNILGEEIWSNTAEGKVSRFNLWSIDNGQYILRVTEKGAFVESFQLILNR